MYDFEREADTSHHGDCPKCDKQDTSLNCTSVGLACADCVGTTTESETYAPSFREQDASFAAEVAENFDSAMDSLPELAVDIQMHDESTYVLEGLKAHALFVTYGDEWRSAVGRLADKVHEHFEKETEPTRFAEYAHWGASSHNESQDTYTSHAELAPVVIHPQLRGALIQLSLDAMAGEDGDSPTVVALGDETLTRYTSQGRVTVDTTSINEGDDE